MTMDKDLYTKYYKLGFQLIELGKDKKPLKIRSRKDGGCSKAISPYDPERLYAIVPPKNIMIIDVDVKKGKKGLESLEKLEADLMMDLEPNVRTGSGGLHIYVEIDRPIKTEQKEYPDIDFICHRANEKLCTPYAVAGGQTITFEGNSYEYELYNLKITEADGIGDLLIEDVLVSEVDDSTISLDDLYDRKTPEEVEMLLAWLPADSYHEWMANASAIKRELGNTEKAFNIFDRWSQTADNYDGRDACLAKWKQVGDYQGAPRTMATLYMHAVENKIEKLLDLIKETDHVDDFEQILEQSRWVRYPMIPQKNILNEIIKALQSKYVELEKEQLRYNDAQRMVKPLYGLEHVDQDVIQAEIEEDENPFSDFVRVASFTRCPYYQISTGGRYDLETIGMVLKDPLHKLSKKLGLKKTMTVQHAFGNGVIPMAISHEYNPTTNERLFLSDTGQRVLNLFNPETVPKETELTIQGKKLINKFIKHVAVLSSESEAETLLDWMAYAAQNPGKKILWVPLIQSVEGVGKSLIGNLLIHHVFGPQNAGVVDSVIIAEKNNSWASSKMLRVLEEIKLSGHNRYEVLNQLKPLITNHTITRVEKFEISSEVRNTCNFLAFTNYKDALPIDEHDRRWWLVFSPIQSLDHLEQVVGMSRQEYFEPLHTLAQKDSPYGTEFKTYLLERDTSNFNPNFPPESKHKEELAEIERGKIFGIDEVQDLINYVYNDDMPRVINMKLIREASEMAIDKHGHRITPKPVNPKEIRAVLKKLGYKNVTKREFADADWKGISPMYYHAKTTTIPEAVAIWKEGFSVDFVADQFEVIDDDEL